MGGQVVGRAQMGLGRPRGLVSMARQHMSSYARMSSRSSKSGAAVKRRSRKNTTCEVLSEPKHSVKPTIKLQESTAMSTPLVRRRYPPCGVPFCLYLRDAGQPGT